MASLSFKTHRLELLAAYQDVIQEQNSIDWALYTYEDGTDNLVLATSGGGGLLALSSHFENQKVMYGFCSVKEPHAMLARYVLINWVGEDVPDARKCACASHVAQVADFFQGVDVIVNASNVEDIDPMTIGQRLTNGAGRLASPVLQRLQLREESDAVGTNYQKTNAAVEMKRLNREQFWEQAKREEEERKQEERQKVVEERLRFEQERMEQERKEQEEREKRYQEREQQIEEHRKKLQDEEAEETKTRLQSNSIFNCLFIPCQMDQRDEDEAAEQKRTESEVEEAAAIIAQRTENPREFFKQQERASSEVNISLLAPRTAVRSSSEAGPPRTPEKERRSSLGEDWNKALNSDQPVQDGAWTPQGLTEDVFMEIRDEDAGFPDAPQLTGCEDEGVMEMGEANMMSDAHPEPPQEASDLLDLWQNNEPQETPWADGNLMTSQEDTQTEQKPSETEACPQVPEENLLNFEELPQPPPTFCDMEAEEDPQSIIHIEGPHQMTLSYQHALQEASCHQPELTDSLLTNGETSQREGTQASEGYFSQSQDEDFAQTDDVSAKATPPVFYNKPPEIDITCWDSDPVMEEEDDEEGGGFGESA
ncbi:PREDICTED: drebrin isoform X1 [Nanorana parkeri]|uniref:drebrin isoform X1 n=1 Tax=Nanorana parkeri TaxID=125878 RepID=UPI000853FAA7|nr:PREDICTED: drebrin isoform X1 [Nanorana parkeri]